MKEITITRNKIKVYLTLFFTSLFYFGLGFFLILKSISDFNQSGKMLTSFFPFAFSCLLFYIGYYTINCYLKNSLEIEIDKNKIIFNDDIYHWEDVDNINLLGKQPFKYFLSFPMEGIKICFKNGDIKYIFDHLYSNAWQAKALIQGLIIEGKDEVEISNVKFDKIVPKYQDFRDYKGNQLLSVYGSGLWGMLIFIFCLIFFNGHPVQLEVVLFGLIFGVLWFSGSSYFLHYFSASEKYLVIRNHNCFWIHNVYNIVDIKEIVFETQDRWPNCLRVITRDYKSKLYPADTLKDRKWIELKSFMNNKGVDVRNECIYDEKEFEKIKKNGL
jgi:hypothetical protein